MLLPDSAAALAEFAHILLLFRYRQPGSYETKWFIPLIDVSLDDRVNVQGVRSSNTFLVICNIFMYCM